VLTRALRRIHVRENIHKQLLISYRFCECFVTVC